MFIEADLHCHSLASSHAYSTVTELADAAYKNGLKAFALTDHAMAMPDAPHEWHFHNIHVIPQVLRGVTVLRGVEANIKSISGDIDMTSADLAEIQWVVASCHLPVIRAKTLEENTAAYVNAIKNNEVIDVIGHCTVSRYPVDYSEIVKACIEYGKFVELNESSIQSGRSTEKNCFELLKICKKYNAPIIVNTDCHFADSIGQTNLSEKLLKDIDFPNKLIFNSEWEKVLEYVSKKHNIILKK